LGSLICLLLSLALIILIGDANERSLALVVLLDILLNILVKGVNLCVELADLALTALELNLEALDNLAFFVILLDLVVKFGLNRCGYGLCVLLAIRELLLEHSNLLGEAGDSSLGVI